jgi:hypothetical protein
MLSVALIAAAVLFGGRFLLSALAREHAVAIPVLLVLLAVQIVALRRNYAEGAPAFRLRATRDVAFIASALLALAVLVSPQRWSVGATIVALECGCMLELFGRSA